MGAESSSELGDIYLCRYEFINNLVQSGQIEKPRPSPCRFDDDILCFDNPFAEDFFQDYVLYPAHLRLLRTANDAQSTEFVGMKLTNIPDKRTLGLSVYEKRDEFPFEVLRYPFPDSNYLFPNAMAFSLVSFTLPWHLQ